MIDYLEDLLEEEETVELAVGSLTQVGRRNVLGWEEETPTRKREGFREEAYPERMVFREGEKMAGVEGFSWPEVAPKGPSGAVRLLDELSRAGQAAGAVRQQAKPLTVTLTGERPQAGTLDLQALDRAVQRDARRYDGGFPLY